MSQLALSPQEFVSLVSHDLRAPIRHMSQFSTILVESMDTLTDDQQQCVDFIQRSSEKCNQMMDALTHLSRIHTRAVEYVPTDFQQLLEMSAAKGAHHYCCKPVLEINDSSTQPFCMDTSHAQTLMQALTDNAFKFRHLNKELTLQLNISSSEGQQTMVFSDNGIGIPTSFIDHCTTIFKQHDNNVEGVGIGLTLASGIASYYQGSLAIESNTEDDDSGTKITMTLPLAV